VATPENKPLGHKRSFTVFRSAVFVFLAVGFLVWYNCGWILQREKQAEAFALHTFGDAWERQSRKLSGPHAIDCGHVSYRGNLTGANECALKAFGQRKPFRVRYDLRGLDSDISVGLVYTPDGKLYRLDFDGDPIRGQGGTSWSRQRVGKTACPLPLQMYINRDGYLNCK